MAVSIGQFENVVVDDGSAVPVGCAASDVLPRGSLPNVLHGLPMGAGAV